MTIQAIIDRVAEEFPHSYGTKALLAWTNDLERDIAEVLRHYIDGDEPMTEAHRITDEEVQIARPDIYVPWLISQICLANEEYDRYNNHMAIFQARYQDWKDEYSRTHRQAYRGKWINV